MRTPTPDILAPAAPDIIGAVFSAAAANDRPEVSWHKRAIDYPVDRVRVGKRMRPQRDVSALAASMADPQVGLINAITLLPDGSLVAGRHRLAAAKLLGWKTIPAVIMELGELDAELVEIDENLRRSELTVLEEAQHQARRDEILRAKGLRAQASSGQNQHTPSTNSGAGQVGAPGAPTITTAQMAAQMGMSERAAQERMQIARGITPQVQELIAEHPVANSTKGLLALARLDSAVQTAVAQMLIDRRAESVTDALGILEQEAAQRAQQLQDERRGAVKSAENGSKQQGAALGKCRICKRPLTDPQHAAAGIGPCCASKAAGATEDATDDEQTEAPAVPVSQRDGYDSDEWYTPAVYIEAARLVLGEIELDPASCSLANTVVKAARYIDKAHDGLRLPWCTGGLWLNPPYSATQEWVDKLIEEFDEERTDAAIILVNNATETRWFQALLRRFPVCFPASRLQFWRHDHENVGARQGQALFMLTRDRAQVGNFTAAFGQFGPVLWVK